MRSKVTLATVQSREVAKVAIVPYASALDAVVPRESTRSWASNPRTANSLYACTVKKARKRLTTTARA